MRMLHLVVRSIATANIVGFGLTLVNHGFSRAVANGPMGGLVTGWAVFSSMALPLFVLVGALWIWKSEAERKATWIDAVLSAAWFLLLWGTVLYDFTHHVIL